MIFYFRKMKKVYILILSILFISVYSCKKEASETEETTSNNTISNTTTGTTSEQTFDISTKRTLLKVTTDYGNMIIYLYDLTPKHKQNYIDRVSENFFDGELFNRLVKGFVLQGGCLDTSATGDVVFPVDPEFDSTLTHVYGAVGGGRYGDDLNPEQLTSGCQLYIVLDEDGEHSLDMQYTVFGQVIDGFTTMDSIERVKMQGMTDTPRDSIVMDIDTIIMRENAIFQQYNYDDFR